MTSDRKVRVRFAPSPTGHLHIGGARTAFFNWLFARNRKGTFILRVEDSDRQRSRPESAEEILEELEWLGLDWDEGPFFQSERSESYREHAARLISEGKAYRAPNLEGGGEALIYSVDRGDEEVVFEDLIRGAVRFSPAGMNDIVLLKSDGTPAYNFACVVDDHEMDITQVIRGEDHISNTPKQLLLYRALGWAPPRFAHLPLILGEDKTRLSKRHGATSVKAFRESGFLAAALRNYLALLGWSSGDDREFFSTEELVRDFSLKRVSKSAAIFDYHKLTWLNGRHIANTAVPELADLIQPILVKARWGEISRSRLEKVISFLGPRLKTLNDFLEQGEYFFLEDITFNPQAVALHWQKKEIAGLLFEVRTVMASVEPFTAEVLENALRTMIGRHGLKGGELIHPLRVAVTGQSDSPGIFQTLELIGKETVLKRLDKALQYWKACQGNDRCLQSKK